MNGEGLLVRIAEFVERAFLTGARESAKPLLTRAVFKQRWGFTTETIHKAGNFVYRSKSGLW